MTSSTELSPKSFTCKNCDTAVITPKHCGRPMILDEQDTVWICWKGEHEPCCGRSSTIEHKVCCDTPDLQAGLVIDDSQNLM